MRKVIRSEELQVDLEEYFKHFHQHPELSGQEHKTTELIGEVLRAHGIEILPSALKTGLLAIIRGGGDPSGPEPRPTVALRADIDALPITEESEVSYASVNEGVQHACGHDYHLTALLGAAVLLQRASESLRGNVLLIFQPAEEDATGAQEVLRTGAFSTFHPTAIFGLHVNPDIPSGTIAVKAGVMSASVDRFYITAHGTGAHGAAPHLGRDVNTAIAELVLAIQTISSRAVNPFEPVVVSVTRISSGHTWNVLPAHGEVEGTARSFDPDVRKIIHNRLLEITRGLTVSTGVTLTLDWQEGPGSVHNDAALTALVQESAFALGIPVQPATVRAGGEDFSQYTRDIPGAFFLAGVGPGAPGHTSGFVADPSSLAQTSRLYVHLVNSYFGS